MSETKQNSNAVEAQPLIIVKQKSALVGFLLAFLGLGWFGIDRFYKGDTMLGLFKLFCPILALIAFAAGLSTAALVIIAIGCFFWLLDWILVPLGISRDNAKKLAQANDTVFTPNNQASNSSIQQDTQSSVASSASTAAQTSDDNQSDLVAKIVFALILLVTVINWLGGQFG